MRSNAQSEGRARRIVRLFVVIAAFVSTFLLAAHVLSFFGMREMEANGAGLMLGLLVMAGVMYG